MGNSTEGGSQMGDREMSQSGETGRMGKRTRLTDQDREWSGEPDTDAEPFGDPLLQRLMMGDWGAVGEMAEDLKNDEELAQELMATLQDLKEKNKSVRTDEEIRQEGECLREAKKRMGGAKVAVAE